MTEPFWSDGGPLPELSALRSPDAPREVMWQRIAAERSRQQRQKHLRNRLLQFALFVAVFAAGYGGRWVQVGFPAPQQSGDSNLRMAEARQGATIRMRVWMDTVLVTNLASSDSLITVYRLTSGDAKVQNALGPWARQLLGTTRLLVESRSIKDSTLMALVSDLDLVLGQIAIASENPDDSAVDRRMARDAIVATEIVVRLQKTLERAKVVSTGALSNATL